MEFVKVNLESLWFLCFLFFGLPVEIDGGFTLSGWGGDSNSVTFVSLDSSDGRSGVGIDEDFDVDGEETVIDAVRTELTVVGTDGLETDKECEEGFEFEFEGETFDIGEATFVIGGVSFVGDAGLEIGEFGESGC